MRLWRPLIGAALMLLFGAAGVFAQEPRPSDAEEQFQSVIRNALRHYELRHWTEAGAFFLQAHSLRPSARTLRGLGLTAYELQKYARSIDYLEQARASVGRARVELEPRSATLRVDMQPTSVPADGIVLLDPGQQELVAEASGFDVATRRVEVESGQEIAVNLKLNPLAGAAVRSPTSVSASLRPPDRTVTPESREPGGLRAALPWATVALSAAIAVTGGVLVGIAASDQSRIEHATEGTRWSESLDTANQRAPVFSTVGYAMLGIGLAGAAVGLAWEFWPRGAEPSPSATCRSRLNPWRSLGRSDASW